MNSNTPKIYLLTFVLTTGLVNGFSQGFVNLDFESAVIVSDPSSPYYPYAVSANDALPGWSTSGCFLGPNDILFNDVSLGAPCISVLGPGWSGGGIIQGNYTLLLTAGVGGNTVSVSQTAMVPMSAESLLFEATGGNPGGNSFVVSLGGQDLNCFALSTGSNYTLYGANISAFAGLPESLTFSDTGIGENFSFEYLDAIQFSASPVPEPNSFGLFGLGSLFIAWLHWRKSAPTAC